MSWKRNLFFIWLSQFFSIMGFAFALPFAPYFMQDLGVREPGRLTFWIAMFASATPVSLAIFSPVWGALADRYGRRAMLLRANFSAWIVMSTMGLVQSVEALVFLRLMQGVFTGTMTAAQAMASGASPANRAGFVLGALSAAVFSGGMIGNFLGGVCAHYFGYRMAFFASGFLLFIAGGIVFFGTREIRADAGLEPLGKEPPRSGMGASMPILLLILAMAFVRQFDVAYLPLLVQEINGGLEGAALWSGSLAALGGVAGLLSGLLVGRLADRHSPPRLGQLAALGAGILAFPQGFARVFAQLFIERFGMIFCSGGLDPVFQVWLSRVTPESRRGTVFGWAGTARSIGWVFAPPLAGWAATSLGIRAVFVIGAGLYLLLIPLIAWIARRAETMNLKIG